MSIEGLPREWMRGPQWSSPEARAGWEPVLQAAAAAWAELEILSVSSGVRPSALLHLTPAELVQATRDGAGQGLVVTPLAWDGTHLRAALGRPSTAGAWLEVWACGDDAAIGELLGFPACCREHFARTWGRGLSDTVTTMAAVDGPPEANLMLRHLGVRLVPHLPCSAACEATVELGRRFAEIGAAAGVDVAALLAVLGLPVEYSALHGIAIISTPHFRLMAGTDWTPDERRATRAGVATAAAPMALGQTSWNDNGFATEEAMRAAHDVVRRVVGEAPGHVLDLGCGDGALLASLDTSGYGIEMNPGRVIRGRQRHPSLSLAAGTVEQLFDAGFVPFDAVLLMPGRLLEMGEASAARVRMCLAHHRRVILYAYGDWLARYEDGLVGLAAAAGFPHLKDVKSGQGVQAAEVM